MTFTGPVATDIQRNQFKRFRILGAPQGESGIVKPLIRCDRLAGTKVRIRSIPT